MHLVIGTTAAKGFTHQGTLLTMTCWIYSMILVSDKSRGNPGNISSRVQTAVNC